MYTTKTKKSSISVNETCTISAWRQKAEEDETEANNKKYSLSRYLSILTDQGGDFRT